MTESNSTIGGATMHADRDALKQKTMAVKEAVVDLAGEARRFAGHRVSEMKDHATELAGSAKDKVKTKAKDANENVVGFVRENPYKSLAIAAGVGFVAGLMLKRRW